MRRELKLFDELEKFAKGHWLTHSLALTFGYDGDAAYDRIWKPLIERFGVPHPIVIADGTVDAGKALGVHVLAARRTRGLFHPKLFVAVRDEAVFVAVGSANLTKGGLGANLELLTTLVFGRDVERGADRSVLEAITTFLEAHVTPLIFGHERSLEAVEQVCRALRVVAELLPVRTRPNGVAFVHSGHSALLDQLRDAHADDVERLVVVSPFWELDGPELEASDSALCSAIDTLAWSSRVEDPRCSLHAGGLGGGLRLPKKAILEHKSKIDLRLQALSKEPRRLHAKLIGLFGPKRTTVLWGSPNFTPPALLRAAGDGGNVECGLLLSVDAKDLVEAALSAELELEDMFDRHDGDIPEPPPFSPPPIVDFLFGELHYDPKTRVLSLHGAVTSERLRRVDVVLVGDSAAVLSASVNEIGHFVASGAVAIESNEDGGLRVLRALEADVVLMGDAEQPLATLRVRVNVAFTDALELRDNYLLGADALSADALLVPPWSVPERRVAIVDARIAALKARGASGSYRGSGHQPSLDTFYKNVRRGLEGRRRELDVQRGSRFGLMRWAVAMRNSLEKATEGSLDTARLAYLVCRVSEHIVEVLDALPKWNAPASDAKRVIEPEKLAAALAGVSFDGALLDELTASARAAQTLALSRLGEMG